MKAIVLAAGSGRRLLPFTDLVPKPMLPVVNRPVLEHVIHKVREAGIREILINLHHLPEPIMTYFGEGQQHGVSITWRVEQELSGPAGALRAFEDVLQDDEHVLILSGDGIQDIDLATFVETHLQEEVPLSIVMQKVVNPGRYGVAKIDERNRLVEMVEKPPLPKEAVGLVSCGIYCLHSSLLSRIPRKGLYDYADLVNQLLNDGIPVHCFETTSYWSDIGTPETLLLTNFDALEGKLSLQIPGRLQEGVFVETGARISPDAKVTGPVLVGEGTVIEPGAQVVGPVVIGANCRIKSEAYVRNAVLLAGSVVSRGTVLIGGLYQGGEEMQ